MTTNNTQIAEQGRRTRERILDVYRERAKVGVPPTLREVADAVGLASTSAVRQHVNRLINEGKLQRFGPRAVILAERD